jgi:tetratricopeptide (TPR) repeat protein
LSRPDPILEARERLAAGRPREALAAAEQALKAAPRDPDALYLVGAAHYRCGELGPAEARLKQAIAADASTASFHAALGNVLQDRGELDPAIKAYRRALRLQPTLAEAHNDLGTAYFARGDSARAVESYRRAAQLKPANAVAWANLGAVYRKLGLAAEARRALQKEFMERIKARFRRRSLTAAEEELERGNPRLAVRLLGEAPGQRALRARALHRLGKPVDEQDLAADPKDAEAVLLLGERLLKKGDAQGAEAWLRRLLALRPAEPLAHLRLGEALMHQQRTAEAEAAYRAALDADPGHVGAWIRLADLLRGLGRVEEAEACAAAALARDDESAAAWHALGMAAKDKGLADLALERFERALALEPQRVASMAQIGEIQRYENKVAEAEKRFREALRLRPQDASLAVALAQVLADQMRYEEAFALLDKVLAREPDAALALATKGVLLDLTGRSAEAEALFAGALARTPDNVDIGYNLAICRLRHGDFATGWRGFELRRRKDNFIGRYRKFPFAEWAGEPLAGKSVLVYPEQGLGDELMYASCIPQLAAQARRVALECDPKLGELFARSFPQCAVIARRRTFVNDWVNHLEPRPDLQTPIGSLPRFFRNDAGSFPQRGGFLKADPGKVARWKARLEALGPGPKIGLSWQGGVGPTGRARRSLTLEQLLPVLRLRGIHFISLQYTEVRKDLAEFASRHGLPVHHWQEAIDDYDETAALVCALDQVLTVCTAIVHLTGALGRPGTVMVPFGSDWRYGASGERMAWYPSLRLVRQSRIGDWGSVLEEVARSL